jgi:hypothetical protein
MSGVGTLLGWGGGPGGVAYPLNFLNTCHWRFISYHASLPLPTPRLRPRQPLFPLCATTPPTAVHPGRTPLPPTLGLALGGSEGGSSSHRGTCRAKGAAAAPRLRGWGGARGPGGVGPWGGSLSHAAEDHAGRPAGRPARVRAGLCGPSSRKSLATRCEPIRWDGGGQCKGARRLVPPVRSHMAHAPAAPLAGRLGGAVSPYAQSIDSMRLHGRKAGTCSQLMDTRVHLAAAPPERPQHPRPGVR